MLDGVDVSSLTVSYGDVLAIKDATFFAEAGTISGILGANGSGKTSLMKGILGLAKRSSGQVLFSGSPLSKVRPEVAYVPQRKEIDWDFPITAADMVLLGTYPRLGLLQRPGAKQKRWASSCLEQLGMGSYANRQVGALSGGQQQRVFMARALAQEPRYLFLDEPFTGVDKKSEEAILDVLAELRARRVTTLLVDHDRERAYANYNTLVEVGNARLKDIVTLNQREVP